MSLPKKKITVFYSWQSTLEKKDNHYFILNALRKAKKEIEKKHNDLTISIDQATEGAPGSPGITETIMQKISLSQIVVSDITIIEGKSKKRSYPNPNVMFELGYAVAEIGWNRIIALTNDKYGFIPEKLPFDVNSQRVSPYNSTNSKKDLENLLTLAIETIILHDPKTPQELRGVSIEKIKHEKDVKSLEYLMGYLHIDTIDNYLENLPNIMTFNGMICWDSFRCLLSSNSFHIYDLTIKKTLKDIYKSWEKIEPSGISYYENHANGVDHIFPKKKLHGPHGGDAQVAWDTIQNSAKAMKIDFKKLIDRIKDAYPEVNLDETDKVAWADIIQYRPKIE
ncbi:nucleotide-binding protein [Citrobacter braakii]|uniref:TIR domain-containing protein n=1 Tax=Citrobacter braakii TaxID=57706 RepID=UPI0023A9BD7C|nr:TIR domain-containing protein [Citrobacter braakii]WEA80112.1 nucleotide-binding protein [Citrobacter braakii]